MSRVIALVALDLVLVSSTPARGASDDRPLVLPIEDAERLAEAHSPLVRRAQRERAVVAAGRVGAGALLPANPVLTFTAGRRRDNSGSIPPATGFEAAGRLEQMIEVAGQRGARLREADRAIDVADARLELARIETRARVRAAYLGASLASRNLEQATEQEALGTRVLDSARRRARAGAGTDIDLSLAEVESGRLIQDRVRAAVTLEDALARLRLAVGLVGRAPITLATPLGPPSPVTASLDALLDRARARRAELAILERSGAQIDATLARLRRERAPNPTLFFDAQSQQPGQLYLGGGIALPLPVWRHNQGELAVARASRALVGEEREIFGEQLEVELAAALRAATRLREAVEQGDTVVLPAAQRNVELVGEGWRAGKLDLFRVVQAARDAAEARRRQLELLGQLWDATIALERATGGAR